jgi:putative DNA primase/helicase
LPESNSIWDVARNYASKGIYVNPVYVKRKPDGKKDVQPVGNWRATSATSLADIGAWEQEHPNASLLIDTGKSGLVVIDPDGAEGIATWLALDQPATARARTPGGGEHWYYRAHPDHVVGNDQSGKVAPDVDVRGLGGFVFAPPSHDGSGPWEWIDGEPDWANLPYVPDLVIERMKRSSVNVEGSSVDSAQGDDSPFDDVPRPFTKTEATAFVKEAKLRLAGTRKGYNGAINNFAMACAHFPWLVDRDLCATLVIRALGPVTGWTEPDHADRATINSAYSATEAGRSWVATEVPEGGNPVGPAMAAGADPGEEVLARTLPPPARPLDVARELKGLIPHTDGVAHRAWWQGDFYRWTGAHWEAEERASVEKWLYRQTGDATYQVPDKQTEKQKADGEKPTFTDMPWAPTRKKIGDLAHALGVGELQREGEEDRGVLAVANGVIEGRELVRHSPVRFNLFSLPFDYEPAAVCPSWLAFLDQVLPDDKEAQEFLAEWFGYVISGRTEQHKMAALIGKKRSGKGTIARVLSALVGKGNVSGLNLGLLSGTFGLEPFVGSALAVASDVRWHSRAIGDAVQILLEVSGEDHVTVSRKNRPAWKGTLGVRFMLMSNDTPTFSDRSGALVDRMLYVAFRQSFYGREDTGLTGKLMGELPGILNWALDGLDRLNARGRFTQPESGRGEQESTRRLADPIGAFIEDWCIVGPGQEIELDHLFLKYQNWCEGEGRKRDSTTKEIFSRDLRSKIDDLAVDRVRVNGKRTRILKGISSEAV